MLSESNIIIVISVVDLSVGRHPSTRIFLPQIIFYHHHYCDDGLVDDKDATMSTMADNDHICLH